MTVDEFEEWIRRLDVDGNGRISRDELRRVMRGHARAVHGVEEQARNQQRHDGYIDDSEINGLIECAQRNLGLRIVPYYGPGRTLARVWP